MPALVEPFLNIRLQDLVDIYRLSQLAVAIRRDLIPDERALEIATDSSPAMEAFLILGCRLLALLQIVRLNPGSGPPYDIRSALVAIAKVALIGEIDI